MKIKKTAEYLRRHKRLFNAFVEFFKKFIQVVAVNKNCLFNGFAVSHGATYAVHTYRLKNFCTVRVNFKAVNDKRILGYLCHKKNLL